MKRKNKLAIISDKQCSFFKRQRGLQMNKAKHPILRQWSYLFLSILLTLTFLSLYYYITKDKVIYSLESLTWFFDFNLHNFIIRNLSMTLFFYFLFNFFYFKKEKKRSPFNKHMIIPISFLFLLSFLTTFGSTGANAMGDVSCNYIDETDFHTYVEGRSYCSVAPENNYGLFKTYTKEAQAALDYYSKLKKESHRENSSEK